MSKPHRQARSQESTAAPASRGGLSAGSGPQLAIDECPQELLHERDLLAAVLDTAGVLIVVLDTKGRIVRFNRCCELTTGYACEEVLGRPFWDFLLAPEEVEGIREQFRRLTSGDLPSQHENDWVARDGSRRRIAWSNTVLTDATGVVEYVIGTGIDVTEQRQSEQARRQSEAFVQGIIDHSQDCIKILDLDGRLKFMSEGGVRLLCISDLNRYLGMPYEAFWEGSDREATLEAIARARAGQVGRFQGYCPTEDGTPKWWDVVISPVLDERGEVARLLAVSRDVTLQKQADDALRESESRYRELADRLDRERQLLETVMESTQAQVAYLDPEFRFVLVNSAYARGSGHTKDELIGRNHFDLFPNAENQAIFERARDTGERVEYRVKPFEYADQPERGITYWDWVLVPVKDAGGQVQGLVLSLLDVTHQERARRSIETLKEQAQRQADELAAILTALIGPLMVFDAGGAIVQANPAAVDSLGLDPAGLGEAELGQRVQVRYPGGQPIPAEELVAARALRGEKVIDEYQVLVRPSGEERTIVVSAAPVATSGRIGGAVVSWHDISDLRRAEAALRASEEKLRTLFDLLPIGISVLDAERRVVHTNAALERILDLPRPGLEAGAYASRTYLRPDGTRMPPAEFPSTRAMRENRLAQGEVGVVKGDGMVTWTHVRAVPVPLDDWKVVVATTDVTARREAEDALRQAKEELERRVEARTRELLEANRLLEQEVLERQRTEVELRRSEQMLEHRVAERTRELVTLLEISNAVALSGDLDPLLHQIVDLLMGVLAHDAASVYRLEGNVLSALLYRGPAPIEEVQQLRLSIDRFSLAHELLTTQRAISIPDLRADTPEARAVRQAAGERFDVLFGYVRSWLGVPLVAKGRVVGLLTLQRSEPRPFDERDVGLAQAFANELAVALENARLSQQAQELAVLEERQHLARELHDAVSQTLFSASLAAEVLPRLWEKDREAGLQGLAEVQQLTRGALSEMRTLLLELRPSALAQTEMAVLLGQLAEATASRARIPVEVRADPHCPLPPDVQVVLYRIAQETLNNVAKHADAQRVVVDLRRGSPELGTCGGEAATQIELSISDDGCGFDPAAMLSGGRGLGLGIMRERAEAVGASFTVASSPGTGTRIVVTWPGESKAGERGAPAPTAAERRVP